MDKLKGITNAFKKLLSGIKAAFTFFASAIGHVVLFIVAAIVLVILIWLIVTVIAKNIAKLIGVDMSPIKTAESDAAFLQSLASSGYDALLDASELTDYYTFEYVVLMDAARFMEETGTTEMWKANDGKYDYRNITREQWAELAADGFAYEGFNATTAGSALSKIDNSKTAGSVTIAGQLFNQEGNPIDENGEELGDDFKDENNPLKAYSTARASGDLYYIPEVNQYTNKTYLVPYLKIIRNDDTLKYYFEIKGLRLENFLDDDFYKCGGYFNLESLPSKGNNGAGQALQHPDYQGLSGTWLVAAAKLRFENPGHGTPGNNPQLCADFINKHVFPYGFDSTLNQNNASALSETDARRSLDGTAQADLYAGYGGKDIENPNGGIFYGQQSSTIEYHVPMRILLDRFLPNANLLASWRHLEDSESRKDVGYSTAAKVVAEIKKVYNEACLENEHISSSKILVKSVSALKTGIDTNTTALGLFTTSSSQSSEEVPYEKYNILGAERTTRFYSYYAGLFDTVSGDRNAEPEEEETDTSNDPPIYVPYGATSTTSTTTTPESERFNQEFPEDFAGDIKDDVRLAITHFMNANKVDNADKKMYEDAINDLFEIEKQKDKLIKDKDGNEFQKGNVFLSQEAIAYRKNGNSYVVKCKEVSSTRLSENNLQSIKNHYNMGSSEEVTAIDQLLPTIVKGNGGAVKTHDKSSRNEIYSDENPYVIGGDEGPCFVPLLRVGVQVNKKGYKNTVVIICDDKGIPKYAYYVAGNEIDDVSQMSNKHTFARFEATDLVSTTFKHWVFANEGEEKSEENWLVTDAFEGLGFDPYCLTNPQFKTGGSSTSNSNSPIDFYLAVEMSHDASSCRGGHDDGPDIDEDGDGEPDIDEDGDGQLDDPSGYSNCYHDKHYKYFNYDLKTDRDEFMVQLLTALGLVSESGDQESAAILAKLIVPAYSDNIGASNIWGLGDRDYGVIRTPEEYKEVDSNTVRNSENYNHEPVEYKPGSGFTSGQGADATNANLNSQFSNTVKNCTVFPADALPINKAQIGDYQGLKEDKVTAGTGGEAVDPIRAYLDFSSMNITGFDADYQIDTINMGSSATSSGTDYTLNSDLQKIVQWLLTLNIGDSAEGDQFIYSIPGNSASKALTPRDILIRELCFDKNPHFGPLEFLNIYEWSNKSVTKDTVTHDTIKNYMSQLVLVGNPRDEKLKCEEGTGCVQTDYFDITSFSMRYGEAIEDTVYTESVELEHSDGYVVSSIPTGACFSAVFPVRIAVSPITQTVQTKQMNAYFVKDAKYWAAEKEFRNVEKITGEFLKSDWNNYHYLITNNSDAQGLRDILSSYKSLNWRCRYFAPIFGADISNESKTRENDVRLIITEWEEAGNQNVHAADHYIRDIYSLIKYSQGFGQPASAQEDETTDAETETQQPQTTEYLEPLLDANNEPYINQHSYQYFYIPDEILDFNPLTSEKVFWMDRIICTRNDAIDETLENVMRSRLPTFTWQKIDYAEYPETLMPGTENVHGVYALWLFGGQTSRSVYAFASSATAAQFDKIGKWGGFSKAHEAADLYGRTQTTGIYNSVMNGESKKDGEKEVINANYGYGFYNRTGNSAVIKAGFNGDKVELYYSPNGTFNKDEYQSVSTMPSGEEPENAIDIGADSEGIDSSLDSTSLGHESSQNFYFTDTHVTINLGGEWYEFSDPFSAVYGYMLYRQTLIEGDAEKAEATLKKQLEREMVWQEVRAVAPGYVKAIGGDAVSGFWVKLNHTKPDAPGGEVTTSYCHMKRYPVVQVGQYVGAGTVIGYEGTTGKSGGFHCHMNLKLNGIKTTPARFMYPFFSPFWNEEQASLESKANYDNNYNNSSFTKVNMESEYMSLDRTSFPYGQVDGTDGKLKEFNDTDEEAFRAGTNYSDIATLAKEAPEIGTEVAAHNKNDYVEIKNYVPQYALIKDVNDLVTGPMEGYGEFSVNVGRTADKTNFSQELVANPDYSDPEFIKLVEENNNKISGVPSGVSRYGASAQSTDPDASTTDPSAPTAPSGPADNP